MLKKIQGNYQMRRIKLLIEYDGTGYLGWQSQRGGGAIQDIISGKLSAMTGEEVKLIGASRTDAGVHALGMVAAFDTGSMHPPGVIMRALNAQLPRDIRILGAEETEKDFHPRYGAVKKSYFYILSTARTPSAFLYRYAWDMRSGLDLEAVKKAASFLAGEHDFSSFMGSGCGSRTQVRTLYSLDVERLEDISFMTASIRGDFIRFRLEANAFLRHMVRNIVGTLVEVGKGKTSPEGLREILECRDRTKAGPTAPARGLFLEKIVY